MKKCTVCLFLAFPLVAIAAGYDTLPAGVNTAVFKQVFTDKIESKYDASNTDTSLSINQEFTTSNLSSISDSIKSYFDELKNLSPDAYNAFSLGEFKAEATAQAQAQGIGLGHGITDHLTIYGSLPVYHLKTDVTFSQSKSSSLNQVKNAIINTTPTTAIGTFIKELTLQLPETNEELLQSVIVNHYGYKPLGTWEKDSLGDAEVGFIYRLTDFKEAGQSISGGIVLPTGSPDDPDNLQDVATGDGQADLFVESNTGVSFYNRQFSVDFKYRFTYQIASNKKLRLYTDPDVSLSENSGILNEKLGNKSDATLAFTYNITNWFNINSAYMYSHTGQTTYETSELQVKNALEARTENENHWGKIGIGLSTVELYKRKKFDAPIELNLSAQTLIKAKNAANYNRFDLDFRLYF